MYDKTKWHLKHVSSSTALAQRWAPLIHMTYVCVLYVWGCASVCACIVKLRTWFWLLCVRVSVCAVAWPAFGFLLAAERSWGNSWNVFVDKHDHESFVSRLSLNPFLSVRYCFAWFAYTFVYVYAYVCMFVFYTTLPVVSFLLVALFTICLRFSRLVCSCSLLSFTSQKHTLAFVCSLVPRANARSLIYALTPAQALAIAPTIALTLTHAPTHALTHAFSLLLWAWTRIAYAFYHAHLLLKLRLFPLLLALLC